MRKFKCDDCSCTWELPHGEGGPGISLSCPECGSRNIHRVKTESFRGRWARNRGRRWSQDSQTNSKE